MSTITAISRPVKGWNITLWIAQVLVAGMFFMAGGMKVFTSTHDLLLKMPGADGNAIAFIRFIGVAELAGAIGLIIPAWTRIKPILTPIAAIGILVIMVLAAALHISKGETKELPVVFALGLLSVFIAWGRFRKAPVRSK